VLLFSCGHILRVLAVHWIGLEPTAKARSYKRYTEGLSALGSENNLSKSVILLWNEARHGEEWLLI
jgi:probable phosphoglycerate mutase